MILETQNNMEEKYYNVYIVTIDDFKAVQQIGKELSYISAKQIEQRGMNDLNLGKYFTMSVEVDSTRDEELQEDLTK